MKICIDPGHGQYGNKGVLGYYEGTQMWHFGQYLQIELEKRGWTVKNTRPRITNNPTLQARGEMAQGCDLFMSLHSNAPGVNAKNYSSIRGATIYDSVADELDYLEVPLVAEIARIMGTPNLGVKHWESAVTAGNDYFGVLRNAIRVGCPDAILIEHGYHTNEQDARWLLSHDNLRRLAAAEADLITRLWRAKFAPEPAPTKGTLYRVQTGAFRVKSNADAFATEIKRKGFDTYLVQADGFFKVQVGAYSVKANADAMAKKLKAAGYDTYITTKSGTPAAVSPAPITTIRVGSRVRVKSGAKTYDGKTLASFVFRTVYDVQQLSGDRAVIGIGGVVTTAIRVVDLILQ